MLLVVRRKLNDTLFVKRDPFVWTLKCGKQNKIFFKENIINENIHCQSMVMHTKYKIIRKETL